jgi:hypothetical protein
VGTEGRAGAGNLTLTPHQRGGVRTFLRNTHAVIFMPAARETGESNFETNESNFVPGRSEHSP